MKAFTASKVAIGAKDMMLDRSEEGDQRERTDSPRRGLDVDSGQAEY